MSEKRIRLNCDLFHGAGHHAFKPGTEVTLDSTHADPLIANGMAVLVTEENKAETREDLEGVFDKETGKIDEKYNTPPASGAAESPSPAAASPNHSQRDPAIDHGEHDPAV